MQSTEDLEQELEGKKKYNENLHDNQTQERTSESKFVYPEFILCKKYIKKNVLTIILNNSLKNVMQILKSLITPGYKVEISINNDTTIAFTVLSNYRRRPETNMVFFDSAIETIIIGIKTATESEENTGISKTITYYGKEALMGAWDSLYGTYSTVRHPIETTKNLGSAIAHPVTAISRIGSFAYQHPVRFGANLLTGWATGKVISFGVGKVAQRVKGFEETAKKTKAATQIAEGTAEKAKIAAQTAKEAAQSSHLAHIKVRFSYLKAHEQFNAAKAAKDAAAMAKAQARIQGMESIMGFSAEQSATMAAKFASNEAALKTSLEILKADKLRQNFRLSDLIKAEKIAKQAAEAAQQTAMELTKRTQQLSSEITRQTKIARNVTSTSHKVSLTDTVQKNTFEAYKAFYDNLLEKVLSAYTMDYMLHYLPHSIHWDNVPHHSLPYPKNLVFEGGGPKGIVYVGALYALEKIGIKLENIERVGGTSAGAIIAMLVSVGYTIPEIGKLLNDLNLEDFLDDDFIRKELFNLLAQENNGANLKQLLLSYLPKSELQRYVSNKLKQHQGLFSGEKLRQWLEDRVVDKLQQFKKFFSTPEDAKLVTFKDLAKLKLISNKQVGAPKIKELAVVGSNVSMEMPVAEIFSAEKTPDVLIVDAVRISLSIPIIFYPHKVYVRNKEGKRIVHPNKQEDLYIDGGCFLNYPVSIFDRVCYLSANFNALDLAINSEHIIYNEETIGLRIEDNFALYEAFLQGPNLPHKTQFDNSEAAAFLVEWIGTLVSSNVKELIRQVLHTNASLQLLKSITFTAQQMSTDILGENWRRTIYIYPCGVGTLDFNLTLNKNDKLVESGQIAVAAFSHRTSFHQFSSNYNKNGTTHRASPPVTFLAESSKRAIPQIQLSWNCFDVAVDLDSYGGRKALIQYALEHQIDESFRILLAPEIKHAAAITAIYMNLKEQEGDVRNQKLIELFQIANALKGTVDFQQVIKCIAMLESSRDNVYLSELNTNALPAEMHSLEVQQLINAYYDAHENMRSIVARCNDKLGYEEGNRLSLEELILFFKIPANIDKYQEDFKYFSENMQRLYTPYENRLISYCIRPDVYRQYILGYYGKNHWFAFQRSFRGENNSSMIDITALFLNKVIVIFQGNEEIYRTSNEGNSEIQITYNGYNHFVKRQSMSSNNGKDCKKSSEKHIKNDGNEDKKPYCNGKARRRKVPQI